MVDMGLSAENLVLFALYRKRVLRTTDGRPSHGISSADTVRQSCIVNTTKKFPTYHIYHFCTMLISHVRTATTLYVRKTPASISERIGLTELESNFHPGCFELLWCFTLLSVNTKTLYFDRLSLYHHLLAYLWAVSSRLQPLFCWRQKYNAISLWGNITI